MVTLEFHEGTLRLHGLDWPRAVKVLGVSRIAWDDRDGCVRAEAFHYSTIRDRLNKRLGGAWSDCVLDVHSINPPRQNQVEPRADQLFAAENFWAGQGRGLIVMPTGTGKTVVAMMLMRQHAASTLIVVPTRDLMYQWQTRILEETGIDAGLIGGGVHRVAPWSVATYESAAIHMARIGHRFSMLILDEVHHLAGQWRCDAARMSAAPIRLGLTATPPDDPERCALLQELIGPTLYRQGIKEATGKTLAEYRVRRIAVQMSPAEQSRYRELGQVIAAYVNEQRKLDSKFQWQDIFSHVAAADEQPERARVASRALRASRMRKRIEERSAGKVSVLEELFRAHVGESVLVFVGSNALARDISLRFMVPCLLSHCGKRERREILAGFADGQFPVLVANQVLDEGIDLPAVKVAIVIGGMGSSRQAVQRLGRVLRRGSGKRKAVLYEVVTEETGEVERSRKRRRHDAYRTGS